MASTALDSKYPLLLAAFLAYKPELAKAGDYSWLSERLRCEEGGVYYDPTAKVDGLKEMRSLAQQCIRRPAVQELSSFARQVYTTSPPDLTRTSVQYFVATKWAYQCIEGIRDAQEGLLRLDDFGIPLEVQGCFYRTLTSKAQSQIEDLPESWRDWDELNLPGQGQSQAQSQPEHPTDSAEETAEELPRAEHCFQVTVVEANLLSDVLQAFRDAQT